MATEPIKDALGRPIILSDMNPIGKTNLDSLRKMTRDIRLNATYRDGVGVLGVEVMVSQIENAIKEIEALRKKAEVPS